MVCCRRPKRKSIPDSQSKQSSNDYFPSEQKLWDGKTYKLLGSGIKYRKLVIFKIQLYAVALYVEEDAAKRELQRLEKKGFFKDYSVDSLCAGLQQGSFRKFLDIRLLRTVTYSQFTGEIGRDLQPRLDQAGAHDLWEKFTAYIKQKSLSSGANLLAQVQVDRSLQGGLYAPEITDFTKEKAALSFEDDRFSVALLDVYLGTGNCVPEAKQKWANSTQALLQAMATEARIQCTM